MDEPILMSDSNDEVINVEMMARRGRSRPGVTVANQELKGRASSRAKAKSCREAVATIVKLEHITIIQQVSNLRSTK